MNPTKCHVINKFKGDNIFCILLQRAARIVLQRAEETFPSVRESMVSVSCLHVSVFLVKETEYFATCFCLHKPSGEFLTLGCRYFKTLIYCVGE
jgi:hypothetical protein